MRAFLLCLLLFSMVCSLGCGDDDSAESAVADGADDGGGGGEDETVNALGETCTSDADCPAEPEHFCVFLQSGAPDVGYCTPVCQSDADCLEGYTGPASAQLACFLPSGDDGCSIVCESDSDCPADLRCQVTGGPNNVCTTPRP